MVNGINPSGKGNPAWPISNVLETKTVPDAIRSGWGVLIARLIGLPRRGGRHLFAMNDEEARWHRWQVTETVRGLGRQYRDPLFDALATDTTLRRVDVTEIAAGPGRHDCPLSGGDG